MFTNRPRTSGCRRARSPTSRPDPMTETREIAAAGPGPNRNPTRKIRKSRRFVASIVMPGRTIRNNSAETVLFFRRHTTCPSLSACRRRDNGRKRTGTPTGTAAEPLWNVNAAKTVRLTEKRNVSAASQSISDRVSPFVRPAVDQSIGSTRNAVALRADGRRSSFAASAGPEWTGNPRSAFCRRRIRKKKSPFNYT